MAAHRYWRLYCLSTATAPYSLSECVFATAIGGAQAMSGGSAFASSTFGGFSPAGAFDGSLALNNANMWAATTGNAGEYVGYDLGASSGNWKDVAEVRITARTDGFQTQTPLSAKLQYSDDNITYTDVGTMSFSSWTATGQTQNWVVPSVGAVYFSSYPGFSITNANYLSLTSTGVASAWINRKIVSKCYFEVTPTAIAGNVSIGLTNINGSSGVLLGANNNGLGYRQNGAVVLNGVTLATLATYTAGQTIGVWVDPANMLISFKVGSGNWNNNVANDPTVGAVSYASGWNSNLTTGLVPAVGTDTSGSSFTGAFTTLSGSLPAGCVTLDSAAGVAGVATKVRPTVSISTTASVLRTTNKYQPSRPFMGSDKRIAGVVKELTVPVAGKTVRLYDTVSGEFLGQALSDGSGAYSVQALGRPSVYAVAFDPTSYQAIVFDQLAPV